MNIWNYDPLTRALLGPSPADPDPLTPGEWLIPAHATTRVPPPLADGDMAVFDLDLDVWVVQPIPAPPEPPPPPPPPPPGPPAAVTMRQARLALLGAGLLAAVDGAIDGLPSPEREAARIEWEYAQEVRRDQPLTQMLATALALTEEDLDQLFTNASEL